MPRLLGLFLLIAGPAGAHALITSPVARNQFDDVKATSAVHPPPCGGPRGTVVMSKNAGDTIMVEWDETVEHPGHYEILFSMANDESFVFLTDPNGAMLNNIADVQGGTLPHHYKQLVKLPSTPCAACTLQMKQFMDGNGYYHSCVDMELRALPVAGPDGGIVTPLPVTPDDGGVDPFMPPEPSTAPEPSMEPTAEAPPDMAMAQVNGTPQSGELEIDYSYGCSASGRGNDGWIALLLFLSVPGIARIGWWYRLRRSRG